jgi:hypothetical protein
MPDLRERQAIAAVASKGNTPPALPSFRWLPVTDLEVDHDYQHSPYQHATEELNRNFVQDLCGAILVNRRTDGRQFIIDGQTRHAVHVIRGLRWILAECRDGMTQAEEAAAYMIKCKNTQRQPIDWFKAGVIAQDPTYVRIHDILAERKIAVRSFATERYGPPEGTAVLLSCVKTLQRILVADPTGDDLREGLDLIIDTWGYSETSFGGQFIETVTQFMRHYADKPAFDRRVFATKVGQYLISDLREMGVQLRIATTPRPSLRTAIQRKMLELYNVGRTNKLD